MRTGVDRALFAYGPALERIGLQVQPRHYYSVIPSLRDLRADRARWARPSAMGGVDLDPVRQATTLAELGDVTVDEMPSYDTVEAGNLGEGMGAADAELLYRMVRSSSPRRVIEIGSGTSTEYLVAALVANGGTGELVCIEPYRYQQLEAIARSIPHRVIKDLAQNVSLDEFRALGPGDIVFIDSSHVVRLDSDVIYLVLEVLPLLAPGVLVHVHDVGFPYPYVVPQHVFTDHMYWTEWALLQAFLQFNHAYEIAVSAAWMHHHHPDALAENLSTYRPGQPFPPSSLWLRRTS